MNAIVNRSQSSGDVLNSLTEIRTIQEQKSDDVKTLVQKLKETIEDGVHNFKHHRIGFETPFVCWSIVIETALILGLFTWIIISEKPNQNRIDNDLKYRYIKMKGDASAEQIVTLENIFELNRDNQKIEQMREDVETYEEAVRKQAALAEQARLKEQSAKPSQSRRSSNSQRIIQTKNQNHEPMASIKVKFRPSTNENKEGTIYYQIIQNRVIRQLKTDYRLFMHEWDEDNNIIIITNSSRQNYLQSIEECIDWDIKRLQSIINQLENKRVKYTADDIISTFQKQSNEQSLFNFMQDVITQLQQMGKQRTSETYRCTLKSFMQFREDKDLLLEDIDSDLMLMYEAHLHSRGLTKNSASFYMRILRAVYNRAVEKDLKIYSFTSEDAYQPDYVLFLKKRTIMQRLTIFRYSLSRKANI